MKISYGLTVCNEHEELENLIKYLIERIDSEDEIVVVYDQNRVTPEVLKVIEDYKEEATSYPFDFQQNFLENKNFMNSKCTGNYIFQIDADEIPEGCLLENLKSILENNPVDLLITPRKNLVEGLQGWVNWPDAQKRIYKNTPEIQWSGHQIHGMVEGYKTFSTLPFIEEWSIIHNKTIDRQENQNERYTKIEIGKLK
jgi:hypothetical protein